ncbi:hypothetical protein PHLCEN_2v9510 [Hermanssonia centrifuga]|uniref:Uncharacterized protein n=1 Tax=Hermanssonia centrifuga TaxID=98765 RepID=A0A2R6NQE7_9APHY|nr:hypothetical protein PHLCEN_2v9510 [Hermanssonia centrifuga]
METTAHNSSVPSPIMLIPPELLIRIIQLYISRYKELEEDYLPTPGTPTHCFITPGPYAWIRVTHVCQSWRDILLSCPMLWNDVVVTRHSECIQAMVSRSQQVPLNIRLSPSSGCFVPRPVPLKSLRFLLSEISRIQSLELYINWWIFDDISEKLREPAPLLRSLTLSTPNGVFDDGFSVNQPVLSLCSDDAPVQLEDLSLSCYDFPWLKPSPFRSLKALRINNCGLYKPAVEDVAYGLQFMPHLATLALHDIFLPSSRDVTTLPHISVVISLSALETLSLSGDSVACTALLGCLDIPKNVSISLRYGGLDTHLDSLSLCIPPLRSVLALSNTSPSTLALMRSQRGCNVFFPHTPISIEKTLLSIVTERSRLSIRMPSAISNLERFCDHIAMQDIRRVWMSPMHKGIVDLRGVLAKLHVVVEVHLTGWLAPDVVELLSRTFQGSEAGYMGRVPSSSDNSHDLALPSMRILALSQVQFGKTEGSRVMMGKAGSELVSSLRDALELRKRRGVVIEKLILGDCVGVTPSDIQSLQDIVDVECRGPVI